MIRFVLYILVVLHISSCFYDVEEELYISECNNQSALYDTDVAPIITTFCLACHSDALLLGGFSLESYSKLKVYIDNNKLLGSIRHDPGFSPMPQGLAKLSKCDIATIEKWVSEGALDN